MLLKGHRHDCAQILLKWYDSNGRSLPWRCAIGAKPEPYHVWVSEIMLQQTTVAQVIPYFKLFMRRWPSISKLASADIDEILHAWQGLGYYARARNLHACSRIILRDYGGAFPTEETELLKLPGIGVYTAAAIAAIAFNQPATPVDGNVERVIARYFSVFEYLPAAREKIKNLAFGLTPLSRPGDYAQAIMDLGATICLPRAPKCDKCPWRNSCAGLDLNAVQQLPRRKKRATKPVKLGEAYIAIGRSGRIFLRRRPNRGLLGGMMEIPTSTWVEAGAGTISSREDIPFKVNWRPLNGLVTHTFTHFKLQLTVYEALNLDESLPQDRGIWCSMENLGDYALPTLMRKVIDHWLVSD